MRVTLLYGLFLTDKFPGAYCHLGGNPNYIQQRWEWKTWRGVVEVKSERGKMEDAIEYGLKIVLDS